MRRRTLGRWVLRAVVAAAVIGGLFAMHGLVSPAATSMPTASMPTAVQAHTVSVQHWSSELPMECGMDHATCVAILPSQEHQHAAGIAVLPMAPRALAVPVAELGTCGSSRSPPDISLIRLCTSRT